MKQMSSEELKKDDAVMKTETAVQVSQVGEQTAAPAAEATAPQAPEAGEAVSWTSASQEIQVQEQKDSASAADTTGVTAAEGSVSDTPAEPEAASTVKGKTEERPLWVRVVCIIVVIVLIGMIVATLIAAIAGARKETILALILCDGIIPIFIWVFLKFTKKSIERRKEAEKYYGQNQN